ncbi:voltage-gated chloride channel [Ephemerocybe angulata]|uniref:Chloride channel protein n=1 Tax=Ephemerocybe angulata TaxID=980116 RepID=A0A8H6I958_9AGAR|nr:voltage-gated chloride channel [Tulosesus angulatus]
MPYTPEAEPPLTPGAPLAPELRRQRLMRIGSTATVRTINLPSIDNNVRQQAENGHISPPTPASPESPTFMTASGFTERTSLAGDDASRNYGTLSQGRSTEGKKSKHPYQFLNNVLHRSNSTIGTVRPTFREFRYSRFAASRPISAYDPPVNVKDQEVDGGDAKINGIRVWYSSFTSIDWLHDAIKDSLRFSRLRNRKSVRARVRLAFDRTLGWIIVTIVGFLTAVVAFLVVKSEQLLFDLKEGYCQDSWVKSKRFCCPPSLLGRPRLWSEVFSSPEGWEATLVEYVSYTIIALLLALASCLLTLYLTDSTTFVTRKESGVASTQAQMDKDSDGSVPQPQRKVMYYAAGSGIPEIKTILSGFVIHGYLGVRVLFTKSVGLALSVASGLSLGKEGPFVHIASCVGNIVSRIASKYELNEGKRREILSAACAAGVAVAFGAPIGGTLFSLEEVSYFFPPKVIFFCAMIAAITLKMLDPFGTGKLVLFQVTYDKDWHAYELVPFLFLGVFGGAYGAYFSKLNYWWSKHVRGKTWLGTHPIAEVLLITSLTSILCFLNPYTRMGGTELVYNLFAECRMGSHSTLCVSNPGSWENAGPVVNAILTAMIVKGALTIVTFGIKVPAGIFIPTLGVGACAGRILGILMQWLQVKNPDSALFASCKGDLNCMVPGLYAMVGAAAALSGVTRTTVSLAVIMFELTDTLTYAVPIMLSVLVAKTVADALEPKGIYDLVIELQQLPYLDYKHEYTWGKIQISDVVSRDLMSIRVDDDNTVQSLSEKFLALVASGAHDSGFPILRKDGDELGLRMVGYIGANELEHALSIVADTPEGEIQFQAPFITDAASSISSFAEPAGSYPSSDDPFDFTPYMDQAPLTLSIQSPLEMLHRFFVKLGARYVVVVDADGLYEGMIEKKNWLAFLSEMEKKE